MPRTVMITYMVAPAAVGSWIVKLRRGPFLENSRICQVINDKDL